MFIGDTLLDVINGQTLMERNRYISTKFCHAPYHRSVQLLGSVVIVVLVPGPVSNMGQESPAQKYV